jgi:hypothetical protein
MIGDPKGSGAVRAHQLKFDLLRRLPIPDNLLPGAFIRTHSRCGKPTCHCADSDGRGHVAWSLILVSANKHGVERIPKQWAETIAEPGGRIEKVRLDLL